MWDLEDQSSVVVSWWGTARGCVSQVQTRAQRRLPPGWWFPASTRREHGNEQGQQVQRVQMSRAVKGAVKGAVLILTGLLAVVRWVVEAAVMQRAPAREWARGELWMCCVGGMLMEVVADLLSKQCAIIALFNFFVLFLQKHFPELSVKNCPITIEDPPSEDLLTLVKTWALQSLNRQKQARNQQKPNNQTKQKNTVIDINPRIKKKTRYPPHTNSPLRSDFFFFLWHGTFRIAPFQTLGLLFLIPIPRMRRSCVQTITWPGRRQQRQWRRLSGILYCHVIPLNWANI